MRKILLGLGTLTTMAAPIAAVISCGSGTATTSTKTMTLNFDDLLKNNGAKREEANEKEALITKAIKDIVDHKATAITFGGKTVQLSNYKDEANNEVKATLSDLVTELSIYYPSVLQNAPQGFATMGKIEFAEKTFEMPQPGQSFDITSKMPKAPLHTSWIAMSNVFYADENKEYIQDAESTQTWWPIEGWKRPYTDESKEIEFVVKLKAEVGYKIKDEQRTVLKFVRNHTLVTEAEIRATLSISTAFDTVSNKTITTLKQRSGIADYKKVLFNGNAEVKFDNSQLTTPITMTLQKPSGETYSDEQVDSWSFNPSECITLESIVTQKGNSIPDGATVVVSGRTYTYYKDRFKMTPDTWAAVEDASQNPLIDYLKTIGTTVAEHKIHVAVKVQDLTSPMTADENALYATYQSMGWAPPKPQFLANNREFDVPKIAELSLDATMTNLVIKMGDDGINFPDTVQFTDFVKYANEDAYAMDVNLFAADQDTLDHHTDGNIAHNNYVAIESQAVDYVEPVFFGSGDAPKAGLYAALPTLTSTPEDVDALGIYINRAGTGLTTDVNEALTTTILK